MKFLLRYAVNNRLKTVSFRAPKFEKLAVRGLLCIYNSFLGRISCKKYSGHQQMQNNPEKSNGYYFPILAIRELVNVLNTGFNVGFPKVTEADLKAPTPTKVR